MFHVIGYTRISMEANRSLYVLEPLSDARLCSETAAYLLSELSKLHEDIRLVAAQKLKTRMLSPTMRRC